MFENIDAWVAENPLTEEIESKNSKINRVAVALGVTPQSIQFWRNGIYIPSEKNLEKMSAVFKTNMKERWEKWLNRRPKNVSN